MSHAALPRTRFFEEIKRRNVGRVATLYLVACWLIVEPVHVIFHMLEVPVWANRLVIVLMALGFVPTIVFAWVYEMTPEGLKPTAQVANGQSMRRVTGRRLDFAIISMLVIALAYFALDKFYFSKHTAVSNHESMTRQSASGPLTNSIAVLPFVDLTEKKDQQYLADGMAEEVIDLLARIPGLNVIGRTSSFQFRNKAVDTREIGKTLGAAYLLEGSLRRSSNHLRITAQLLDTRDGTHRWSNTFDARLDDALRVQDAIAAGIARALQVTVQNQNFPDSRDALIRPAAHELYLRGLHFLDLYTAEGCEQAAAAFQEALELEPKYIAAEIGLAKTYDFVLQNAWLPTKAASERVIAAANRALAIDPQNAAAHIAIGRIRMEYDWDWAAAEREYAAALALGARDPDAFIAAGALASARGDWNRAISLFRQALAKDPLNPQAYMGLGWYAYARMGRLADAETAIRRALEIDPGEGTGHFFLAITLLSLGRTEDALAAANQETIDDGQLEASAAIYHALNRKAESDRLLERAIEQNATTWASAIAKIYAFRGDNDNAIRWLNRAYEQKDEDLYFILGDPLLHNLETDSRYQEFLHRMNLPSKSQ